MATGQRTEQGVTLRGHLVRGFTLNERRLTGLTVVDPLPTVGGSSPE